VVNIIAQLPVSNNIAELPGLDLGLIKINLLNLQRHQIDLIVVYMGVLFATAAVQTEPKGII